MFLGVIIGALLGRLIQTGFGYANLLPEYAYVTPDYTLSVGDILSMFVGLGLFGFGNRIHNFLRWVGAGIFVSVLIFEVVEATHKIVFE